MKIQDNELCAIMGASGSGKSTLLHIIGAMDDVTGGSYLYNDIPVSKLSKKIYMDLEKICKFRVSGFCIN